MVAFEYRVVLPFTLEEFRRGFDYACARQAHEVAERSANGELVMRVAHAPFEGVPEVVASHGRVPERHELCRGGGQYTRNRLYLGTRFPSWVRKLLPNGALYFDEEYWYAYPYAMTRYRSELWPTRVDFTIESLHVGGDAARKDDVFRDLTPKERAACPVQVLDIGAPVPAASKTPGVILGDPTAFRSSLPSSKHRPLVSGPGWWRALGTDTPAAASHSSLPVSQPTETPTSSMRKEGPTTSVPWPSFAAAWSAAKAATASNAAETSVTSAAQSGGGVPLMTVYKRAHCEVTRLVPFATSIERITLESTVRDMALLSFRNLYCWMDDWLPMSDAAVAKHAALLHDGVSRHAAERMAQLGARTPSH